MVGMEQNKLEMDELLLRDPYYQSLGPVSRANVCREALNLWSLIQREAVIQKDANCYGTGANIPTYALRMYHVLREQIEV